MSKKQKNQTLAGKSPIPVPTESDESPSTRQALASALEALRKSEAKYRKLVQLANSAIIRWKRDGTIRFFNEYAQDFFGYTAAEAVGQSIGMLLPDFESTGADLRAVVRDAVEHPDRYRQFVNENICRDGRRVWMAWTNRPILDKQGRVTEILSVGSDITALKKAEEQLKAVTAQLEQRVRERTAELSRTVLTLQDEVRRRTQAEEALRQRSEQLRNLASELTLAEQRERRRLAEVLHDNLQQLLVGAKLRLSMLDRQVDAAVVQKVVQDVQNLLDESIDCSRSLTGELSPPILHQGGLPAALEWLAAWMKQKHEMAVDLDVDQAADPTSEDMRVLLFQSTRELLFNAVKHAKVDNVRVHLKRNAGDVEVTVADEGAGFNPATIMPQTGKAGGFGLFSIRERLDLLGGKLEIQLRRARAAGSECSRPSGWPRTIPSARPCPSPTSAYRA